MKKIKENRAVSFIVIFFVYVIAAAAGFCVYNALGLVWWLKLLIADIAATVITFIFSVIFKNASVYDPYWSVQPIVILFACAVGKKLDLLRILLLIAVTFWGVRLTANWAYTFKGLDHQDWRYTMLKEKTGTFYPVINFIGIHLMPTLIVYGCILPACYAFQSDTEANLFCFIPFVISIGAVILQGTADIQMHRYRKNRTGNFMRTGLWKYSRHPNYLGEILMWWGVASMVCVACPDKWFLMSGALTNTILFLTVSIPMADNRQAAKDGFSEYKKQTRMPCKRFHKNNGGQNMSLKLNLGDIYLTFQVKGYHKPQNKSWDEEWCKISLTLDSRDWLNYKIVDDEILLCCEIDAMHLSSLWFFYASLISLYTGSFESTVENHLNSIKELTNVDEYKEFVLSRVNERLTNDYFDITLVGSEGLAVSGRGNNAWNAYVASLNILNAGILFSKSNLFVSKLFEPGTDGKRKSLEKHHLFPKAYLKSMGYSDAKINQMANYAYIDWKDNMDILDDAPSIYYPIICNGKSDDEIRRMESENALPHGWENMAYEDFLEARRRLMAAKIKAALEQLKKNVQ